jgi:hypothetical protein
LFIYALINAKDNDIDIDYDDNNNIHFNQDVGYFDMSSLKGFLRCLYLIKYQFSPLEVLRVSDRSWFLLHNSSRVPWLGETPRYESETNSPIPAE